ncbi:MAG: UDP-N-acetylmuramoyl-L-alanine--D-glutamate ligase [Spirochaetes bacterium]|nr:UDP-N-acetylmuramoyl-L-alanine--D-glutamate ligase [Spirochaetota bacterium]
MEIINHVLNKPIDFNNKNILVMGLGLNGGGVGVCKFLSSYNCQITVTDLKTEDELKDSIKKIENIKNIRFVLGEHREEDFLKADIIIKAAGIKWDNKYIKLAIENGKKVDTDIGIFFELSKNKKVGITGSKGKSTTTTLIHKIYKDYYPNTKIGGNITVSVLEDFDPQNIDSIYILELSSWQLDDMSKHKVSPQISVFLNLLPDHLNYYGTMENYLNDKKKIYLYQKEEDYIILNIDNHYIYNSILEDNIKSNIICISSDEKRFNQLYEDNQNKGLKNNIVGLMLINKDQPLNYILKTKENNYFYNTISEIEDFIFIKKGNNIESLIKIPQNENLQGEHNQYNIASSIISALISKIPVKSIINSIKNFEGLKFRNQKIRTFKGINFINDTTATIPAAVASTLSAYKEQTVILIAGGVDKKVPLEDMVEAIHKKCKAVILLEGDGSQKLLSQLLDSGFKNIFYYFNNLKDAIYKAIEIAKKEDNILLSPGFASFNLFKNEFERGEIFNKIVNELEL